MEEKKIVDMLRPLKREGSHQGDLIIEIII